MQVLTEMLRPFINNFANWRSHFNEEEEVYFFYELNGGNNYFPTPYEYVEKTEIWDDGIYYPVWTNKTWNSAKPPCEWVWKWMSHGDYHFYFD